MSNKMGRTKRSTDNLIDDAVTKQQDWHEKRRSFARVFLKSMNIFAKSNKKKVVGKPAVKSQTTKKTSDNYSVLREYWFPILCAFIVIFVTIWVLFNHAYSNKYYVVSSVPAPVVQTVANELKNPQFDAVRVDNNGKLVVIGHWKANSNISIFLNDNVVATIMTDENGEFVYAPTSVLPAGNYTVSMMDVDSLTKSAKQSFTYAPKAEAKKSLPKNESSEEEIERRGIVISIIAAYDNNQDDEGDCNAFAETCD